MEQTGTEEVRNDNTRAAAANDVSNQLSAPDADSNASRNANPGGGNERSRSSFKPSRPDLIPGLKTNTFVPPSLRKGELMLPSRTQGARLPIEYNVPQNPTSGGEPKDEQNISSETTPASSSTQDRGLVPSILKASRRSFAVVKPLFRGKGKLATSKGSRDIVAKKGEQTQSHDADE